MNKKKTTKKQTGPYLIRRTIKYDLLNYSWGLQPTAGMSRGFLTHDQTDNDAFIAPNRLHGSTPLIGSIFFLIKKI